VNAGILIEVVNADVTQNGTGDFGKEALDKVE
jgi:hypothetical protein